MLKARIASMSLAFGCSLFSVVALSAELPAIAHAVSRSDIQNLYSAKTWLWKHRPSGIYFSPAGTLVAYEKGKNTRTGTGRWSVDNKGRLCVNIQWRGIAGRKTRSSSCWSHRRTGNIIWKQRAIHGQWYNTYGKSNENVRILLGNRLPKLSNPSAPSQ